MSSRIHSIHYCVLNSHIYPIWYNHTFFMPISLDLLLSLLTWDSAISARSSASSRSCCCFLYFERYRLAWASWWEKTVQLISSCPHETKLFHFKQDGKCLAWLGNSCMRTTSLLENWDCYFTGLMFPVALSALSELGGSQYASWGTRR